MDEAHLEIAALAWFEEIGWELGLSSDMNPSGVEQSFYTLGSNELRDRPDLIYNHALQTSDGEVILETQLREAFECINSWIPQAEREEVYQDVLAMVKRHQPDLLANNRQFHQWLIEGFPITIRDEEGEKQQERAYIIDFQTLDNNRFLVRNQVTIVGRKTRRPDIVAYVNGLPMVVLELKSPLHKDSSYDANLDALNQLNTYKHELHELFISNAVLVVSDGLQARFGSLSAGFDRFMPWRAIKNEKDRPYLEYELETLIKGLFEPKRFMNYLQNFILFTDNRHQISKIVAGYHQYHAVENALEATRYATSPESGDGKIGVIWHTQGSGKSYSMAFYVGKIIKTPELQNPTIVVVTDRNDLDDQLFATFTRAKALFNNTEPVQASTRAELRQRLAERAAGGIIFTTVQKFAPDEKGGEHPVLNERRNIIVISDEAHRTQYGLNARMNEEGLYTYGYAKYMRDAIPNAAFIGFTGTPIEESDRSTRAVFGENVSVYDIQDAVEDGATVPIYYEARLAQLKMDDSLLDDYSNQLEDILKDADVEEREKVKQKWSRLERLAGAPERLKMLAQDMIEHFEKRSQESEIEGKAMVVAMSRAICVDLYHAIIKIRPEWHSDNPQEGAIKVIMTGSASDPEHYQPHLYSKEVRSNLENRFKDPNDPFKMVIVCDMWLTGFDAPSCHTMYIDKPMRGHNLMQAIARVNRVFEEKAGGLVVDYIGIASELEAALKTYTNSDGKGAPTINAHDAFAELLRYIEIMRNFFAKTTTTEGFDLSGLEGERATTLLIPAANYILGIPENEVNKSGKHRFLDTLLAIRKAFSLCSTLEEAKPYEKEIAFYTQLGSFIRKATSTGVQERKRLSDDLFERVIANAVQSAGVIDLYEYVGLENPRIDILDERFFNSIRKQNEKNLALEMLKKLMRNQIRANLKTNVVQELEFSARLRDTMNRYNNRTIDSVEAIEELIKIAKELTKAVQRGEELGLQYDELAFYQALSKSQSAVEVMSDERLKEIAIDITEQLRKNVTVDWQKRESVRAKLRLLVRQILRQYHYPIDKSENAENVIELIMKNTELLADEWSAERGFKSAPLAMW